MNEAPGMIRNVPWIAAAGALALFVLASSGGNSSSSSYPTPTPAPRRNLRQPKPYVRSALQAAGDRYGVPMDIMLGVAHTESRYNPLAGPSRAGAMGLMQLMPRTAAGLGVADPWDARQNAMGGAKFLANLKRKYSNWPQALAAYNWGPGNVNRRPTRSEWPGMTQNYVDNVLSVAAAVA